jgi:hypothetical protein
MPRTGACATGRGPAHGLKRLAATASDAPKGTAIADEIRLIDAMR